MIANAFLSFLCCPETKQALVIAEGPLTEKLNRLIAKRALKNRAGEVVIQKLGGGLVRADKKFLYPILNDIPVMLRDEAIPLEGVL